MRPQQGRLAGAVGAEHGDQLALLHVQVDAPQGFDVAVTRRQPFDREDASWCRAASLRHFDLTVLDGCEQQRVLA